MNQTLDDALKNPTKIDMEKFRANTAEKLSELFLEAKRNNDVFWGYSMGVNNSINSSILESVNLKPFTDFDGLASQIEKAFENKPYKSLLYGRPDFSNVGVKYFLSGKYTGILVEDQTTGESSSIRRLNSDINTVLEYGFFTRDLKSYGIEGVVVKETKENKKLRDEISFLITPDCEKDLFFDYIAKIDPETFKKGFEEYAREKDYIDIFETDGISYLRDNVPNLYPLSNPETIVGIMNHLLKKHGELRCKSSVLDDLVFKKEIEYIINENNIGQIVICEKTVTLGEGNVQNHYVPISVGSGEIDAILIKSKGEKKIDDDYSQSTPFTKTSIISPVHVYNQLFGK